MTPLTQWGIDLTELSSLVDRNPSLRGFLFGYVAQDRLISTLKSNPAITSVTKADDHDRKKKGHIVANYKGSEIRLEARSLQISSIKVFDSGFTGSVQCDASDRREITVKSHSVTTTCLKVDDFDVLATCVFPFTGKWEFMYCLSENLPRSTYKKYPVDVQKVLIQGNVRVKWPAVSPFVLDPLPLFEKVVAQQKARSKR